MEVSMTRNTTTIDCRLTHGTMRKRLRIRVNTSKSRYIFTSVITATRQQETKCVRVFATQNYRISNLKYSEKWKWVWPGNTTTTDCRLTHGTMRKRLRIQTAASSLSLSLSKVNAILESNSRPTPQTKDIYPIRAKTQKMNKQQKKMTAVDRTAA